LPRSSFSLPFLVVLTILLNYPLLGCVLESAPNSPQQITSQLIALLKDPHPDSRRTAALSLGKIGNPRSIPPLVTTLSDPDEEVRQWSAWALGSMSDSLNQDDLMALIQHVADPSDRVRQAVVLALGRSTPSEEVLRVLSQAFSISSPPTQLTIIQILSQFEFPFSYSLYLEALQHSDAVIRQSAIAGLGELGDPRGLLVFRTHLLQDSNVGVRSEAAFRLGILGGKADVPALRQARDTDPTPNVHFWASWSLNQIDEVASTTKF